MVLPYTQVKYVFGTSAVSPALETYYGCIMGKATRLHDLKSHGWFLPKDDDCTPSTDEWLTYEDGTRRINPEGTDGAWAYPKFSRGNTVNIPTVRTYFKGGDSKLFKYVNFYKKGYRAIPYDEAHFRIVNDQQDKVIYDSTSSVKPTAFLKISDDGKTLSVVSTTPMFDDASQSKAMLPGTLNITLKLKHGDDLITVILTDVSPDDPRVRGVLYVQDAGSAEYFKTSNKLAYKASTSDYTFKFDTESKLVTTADYVIDKVESISYDCASYIEADKDFDLLNGIVSAKDMFYLGPKNVSSYYPGGDPDDDDDDDSVLELLAATDSEFLITEGGTYLLPADMSSDDVPSEGDEGYEDFIASLEDDADEGTTLLKVKKAFKDATNSLSTLKSYRGGVITVLKENGVDHASRVVTAGYPAFDSSDYRPFIDIAACACRTSADNPMRINLGINPNTGALKIEPATLTFTGREYDPEEQYLMTYDTEPGDRPELPCATDLGSNFVCGYFRLEYEEMVTSNVMTGENGLYFTPNYSTDGTGTSIEDLIGQMDPRNQLGFAYGLVKQLTTSEMYVLACTDLKNGTDTLEKYRNIFHVWYVSDDGPEDAFYNWIDHENQKEQSRFRIGYQFKPIKDSVTRTDFISAVLRVDADNYYPYALKKNGAGFSSELKVIPGDLVKDKNHPDTVLTVKSVSDDLIEFDDAYIPSYFIEAEQFTPDGVASLGLYDPFKAVYTASENGGRKLRTNTLRVRINYSQRKLPNGTIISQDVWEGTWEDAKDEFDGKFKFTTIPETLDDLADPITFIVESLDMGSEERWSITECSFDARYQNYTSDFEIYRIYTPMEKAARLAADQTSTNMACVTVLTRDVNYQGAVLRDNLLGDDTAKILSTTSAYVPASSYTKMPDYATPGLIFGTKLATQPHMPLTLVSFSLPGIGEVLGLREFSHDDLETLLDAGYCMINSEVGGLPYCETDCTVGYPMYGDSDRGLLSKITPVLMYGKDVYNVTKRWKGPMNTGTPELLSGLGTSLVILKKKYTETRYNLLGTLLKKVSDASISFDGSHILIDHHISSQDPARYIDNTVYVE